MNTQRERNVQCHYDTLTEPTKVLTWLHVHNNNILHNLGLLPSSETSLFPLPPALSLSYSSPCVPLYVTIKPGPKVLRCEFLKEKMKILKLAFFIFFLGQYLVFFLFSFYKFQPLLVMQDRTAGRDGPNWEV